MSRERIPIHIGNPDGRIVIWCDENEAIDIASHYSYKDGFHREIMEAVEKAYPKEPEHEEK